MGTNLLRIVDSKDFSKWVTINDTIMGGSSEAECATTTTITVGLFRRGPAGSPPRS